MNLKSQHPNCSSVIYNVGFGGFRRTALGILSKTSTDFITNLQLIKRINQLAKKSKEEGLTDEEKNEQAALRQEYIKKFRQGMENTLSNVYIMDENGNKRKVEKKK